MRQRAALPRLRPELATTTCIQYRYVRCFFDANLAIIGLRAPTLTVTVGDH
jgi:hypothetical protein